MAIQKIRFNKTTLSNLVREGQQVIVRDSILKGLRFKVGPNRSVFQFEKRVSGRKGAPITFTLGAFPAISIDDARQEARRLTTLCEKGIDPRNTNEKGQKRTITLQMAIDQFFEFKKELARSTLHKYRSVIKYQFPSDWMEKDIQSITSNMLVDQFKICRQTARERCWEFLKVFGNIWNTCAPYYRNDQDRRIFGVNPVPDAREMLKNVRRDIPRRSVISVNLLGKFVVTLEDLIKNEKRSMSFLSMWRIALLSLFTAFRFHESRHLKWDYVDLENGIIHLPGVVKDESSFEGTKNHKDHWVPLSTYAWDLLRVLYGERNLMSPFVFPALRNPKKPVIRDTLAFKKVSLILGCHYSPHASRRTFASVANEAGLGFLTVKRMLNHAFEGGVTGGYVRPDFNPGKGRDGFQRVCDYILDLRAEYLGEKTASAPEFNRQEALEKLKRYALELGLDLTEALENLTNKRPA